MKNEKFDVNNADEFQKVMGDRLKKARQRQMNENTLEQDTPQFKHAEMANLMLKVVGVIKMDPMIKKVLSMRIVGPLKTGQERTRFSIAIELGLREREVEEIESAGLEILDGYLQRFSAPEFIEKFNRDKRLAEEVKRIQKGKPE